MSRPAPYYAPLEDATFDFHEWERRALADGEVTPDEAMALYPAIKGRMPDLVRVVRTCRAMNVLGNTQLGIDSPTVDRVLRELRRATAVESPA